MMNSIRTLAIITALLIVPSVTLAQGSKGNLSGITRMQTATAQKDLRRALKPWKSCFQNAARAKTSIVTCRGKFRSYKTKAKSVAGKN